MASVSEELERLAALLREGLLSRSLARFALFSVSVLLCLLLLPGSPAAEGDQGIEKALQPAKIGPKHAVSKTRCPKGTKLVGKPPPKGNEQFCQHKKEGHKSGPYAQWHASGQPQVAGTYLRDKKHGKWTSWHENGQVKSTGSYLRDKRHGKWAWWHENDQVKRTGSYDGGVEVGEWREFGADGREIHRHLYRTPLHIPSIPEEKAQLKASVDWRDPTKAILHCGHPATPFAEQSSSGEWTMLTTTSVRLALPCTVDLCSEGFAGKLFCNAQLASLVDLRKFAKASEFLATLDWDSDEQAPWSARIEGGQLRELSTERVRWPTARLDGPEKAADLQGLRSSSENFKSHLGAAWFEETEGVIAQSVIDSVVAAISEWNAEWKFSSSPSSPQLSLVGYIDDWAGTVEALRESSSLSALSGQTFKDWAHSTLRAGVEALAQSLVLQVVDAAELASTNKLDKWVAAWTQYMGEEWKKKTLAGLAELQAQRRAELQAERIQFEKEVRVALAHPDSEFDWGALIQRVADANPSHGEDWRLGLQKKIFKSFESYVESELSKGARQVRKGTQEGADAAVEHLANFDVDSIEDLPAEAIDAGWSDEIVRRSDLLQQRIERVTVGLSGLVCVQDLGLGGASYHFLADDAAYINYSEADFFGWRLDNGEPVPIQKWFVNTRYVPGASLFRGTIDWTEPEGTTFGGDLRWEYEMVFDDELSQIRSGKIVMLNRSGATTKVRFGVDLLYTCD